MEIAYYMPKRYNILECNDQRIILAGFQKISLDIEKMMVTYHTWVNTAENTKLPYDRPHHDAIFWGTEDINSNGVLIFANIGQIRIDCRVCTSTFFQNKHSYLVVIESKIDTNKIKELQHKNDDELEDISRWALMEL